MLFELVIDKLGGHAAAPALETAVPTEAELRQRARALGVHVPARKGTAERFRDEMFELLTAATEPVATKIVLPVQVASFEC